MGEEPYCESHLKLEPARKTPCAEVPPQSSKDEEVQPMPVEIKTTKVRRKKGKKKHDSTR